MKYYNDIRAAAEGHLVDNWTETSIAFDNMEFDPPADDPWIRAYLRPMNSVNAAIGHNCKRDNAIFVVQVFTKINSGPGKAYDLASKIETLFSNKIINKINFYQATTDYIGDDGHGWFQLNVICPCWIQSS